MIRILIVSSRKQFTDALTSILGKHAEVTFLQAESGDQGLSMIREEDFHLVITDENLSDMTGLVFAQKMISVNPMLNCAVATSLAHDDFHEASEGMGILMGLPLVPDEDHVKRLLESLYAILQMTTGSRD